MLRFRMLSRSLLACAAALLLGTLPGHAASYSSVVVYGDSLSDNGNLYHLIGYPPAPYYNGRFSNGPVAVEQLASSLGAPLLDYAYGGATTGIGNIVDAGTQTTSGLFGLPGMAGEIAGTIGIAPHPGTVDPNALFVVWGGANDFEAAGSPTLAAANVAQYVALLQADGAQHILVPNLPDLSLTPEFYGDATARAYTNLFNSTLTSDLSGTYTLFDTYGLLNAITADPSAYGFTNTTTPCITALSTCGNSLFFDDIHPTTAADAILAQRFAAAVNPTAATPEPSSLLLLCTGITGLTPLLRRRKQTAA